MTPFYNTAPYLAQCIESVLAHAQIAELNASIDAHNLPPADESILGLLHPGDQVEGILHVEKQSTPDRRRLPSERFSLEHPHFENDPEWLGLQPVHCAPRQD